MSLIFPILHFWLCHPALLYGTTFFLGVLFHVEGSVSLIFPSLSLWLPFILAALLGNRAFLKPWALSCFIFFTAWIYTAAFYSFPSLPPAGITGKAHLRIKNVSLQSTPFGERWCYRCELKQFFSEQTSQSLVSSLPCLVIFPNNQVEKESRPLATQEYWVTGKLMQTTQSSYVLKVPSKNLWIPIAPSKGWVEERYRWKTEVSRWIESQFFHPASGSFLAGLVTGEFDDFWMRQQLMRFGLQHLLAISGFHFAMIAGFLSVTLRLFLPHTIRTITLLVCLAAYCFFLGPQASILRAWVMSSLTLVGSLLRKETSPLNSLGFALLVLLGYNPLLSQELGFQLSFATTTAILLFYSPAQAWMQQLFPKRNLSQVLQMTTWNQYGYCLLTFLREGCALTLAVSLFAFPLTLFFFGRFPWMSLLYNLFFPFLTSGALYLFLIGALLFWVPLLGKAICSFNDAYTFFLLQLTYQMPSEIETYLTIDSFSSLWLTLYFCCALLGGIFWKERSVGIV